MSSIQKFEKNSLKIELFQLKIVKIFERWRVLLVRPQHVAHFLTHARLFPFSAFAAATAYAADLIMAKA